nr:ead/Ea22-like family protein [Klebsiella pneumoniae]
MTDITELAQSLKAAANKAKQANDLYLEGKITQSELAVEIKGYVDHLCNPNDFLALVEALEKAQQRIAELDAELEREREKSRRVMTHIAELESRTVKLPDGWQFEECEADGCGNGAIFNVGTGIRNIHLCDKCAHEPQNSRLKKYPLSKRLPFKMSAGIKVEAE